MKAVKDIADYFEYSDLVEVVKGWGEYYEKGEPVVSDHVYDTEYLRIKRYELVNVEEVSNVLFNSPTQMTASGTTEGFKKIDHVIPMISIANSMGTEEMLDWAKGKLGDDIYSLILEYKLDGLALSLKYNESGLLLDAITRGQNGVGDSVINNAYQIENIPQSLPVGDIEIRGEVVWLIDDFNAYNDELIADDKKPLSNPRNGAAGTMKQKNPLEVKHRKLTFIAYSIADGSENQQHHEDLDVLTEYGFTTSEYKKYDLTSKETSKPNDIIGEIRSGAKVFEESRAKLPYLTDGLVLKVDDKGEYDRLGGTSKTPHYLTALKFPPEEKVTKLIDIEYSYGKSGAVTPVAIVETVNLALTNVNRASLHNWDMVEYLGLYKGCNIIMRKAGEIIPQVVGIDGSDRTIDTYEKLLSTQGRKAVTECEQSQSEDKYIRPVNCKHCDSVLEQSTNRDGEELVAWICPNSGCSVKQHGRIVHFVSKNSMNIMNVGESLIEALLSKGLIKNVADLYKLTVEDVLTLDSFKLKSAEKAISAINDSRNGHLNQLLSGLGITNLGRTASTILAEKYNTISDIVGASVSDLQVIEGIGDSLANNITEYFASESTRDVWGYFIDNNIAINAKKSIVVSDKLKGKNIIMTGKSDSISRVEFKKSAAENGANIISSISKKVDYVILGEDGVGPSKMKKIMELQSQGHSLQTLSALDYLDMIK